MDLVVGLPSDLCSSTPVISREYLLSVSRSEEHTSELQSHRDLHSFPTRRSSDLIRVNLTSSHGSCGGTTIRPLLIHSSYFTRIPSFRIGIRLHSVSTRTVSLCSFSRSLHSGFAP